LKHYASPDFWACFNALPNDVQTLAKKNYLLLKRNPRHPSLCFKKVTTPYWSIRVGINYRALAIHDVSDEYDWIWIGSHAEYDKLIK
jgi:hypothetical protein